MNILNIPEGRPFGPNGCQVPVGKGVCGETRKLDIINEFRALYQKKMDEIQIAGGGDCLMEKLKLQDEWIDNLTEQNEMLVKVVEELEHEATERVQILEEKLHRSAQCICEVMNKYRQYDVSDDVLAEPLEKVFRLENDRKNLLEFLRRIREERRWCTDGLKFFEISYNDLFGNEYTEKSQDTERYLISDIGKEEQKRISLEKTIAELRQKLEYMSSFGNVEFMAKELQCKQEECENLKKEMIDMRQALTEEVASKHDIILQLKKECQQLEDRCIQADKQTAFRDDIIKELRKEIKQLKQQLTQDEIMKLNETVNDLQKNLHKSKKLQAEEEKSAQKEICTLKMVIDELQSRVRMSSTRKEHETRDKEAEISKLSKTIDNLNNHLDEADKKVKEKQSEINGLSETIKSLENNLKDVEGKLKVCKMCKRRSNVGFSSTSEVQANCDEDLEEQLEKQSELLQKRDEIIKVQTSTLKLLENEIAMLKKQAIEKDKYCDEIQCLKNRINELEIELKSCEEKSENFQNAIELYLNSINILEATEAKCNIEITQQKATIANLQKALITAKQELENVKQKAAENEAEELKLISNYTDVICIKDVEMEHMEQQVHYIFEGYENLQTFIFELELEHCNSLQDIDMLENQLYKYQHLLKCEESCHKQCRSQVKKLTKQKRCYEEVIAYFKQEMALMSDQLVNLQELLTLSYASVQEENCRLNQAFLNVQTVNDQLAHQLCAAEQKILLENQMNQLNEAKICELEKVISDKELDLGRHDKAIINIRQTLKCSLKQNEELHETIVSLNATILQLQNAIKKYELDNTKSRESAMCCQEQIDMCKQKLQELKTELEKKTAELCKLEAAYNKQNRTLKSAQVELQEMRDQQKDKQCHMRCIIQELEDKFRKSEEKYKELLEDYRKIETQLGILSRREAVKEVEIQRYRKIVVDLKKTLIDLNKSLTKRNFKSKCENEDCKKYYDNLEAIEKQDIPPNCPCEVEFYQSIVETLKKSVTDLKKKLTDFQKKNQELEEKCRCNEARFEELSKTQIEKDKECNELRQQLTEKLRHAQQEESRYLQLAGQFEKELGSIRQELELRTKQLDDVRRSAQEISSCRCVQLVCAQEEVSNLKEELNKLLKKHCSLNAENQRLHQQSAKIQALEENRQLLKGQLEQYLIEVQTLQSEKESLVQKNHELLAELRNIQSSSNKQQRYSNDSLKILETELNELKSNHHDICVESKNIITYFRTWLEEQKKINEYISNKERNYRVTIKNLQQKNEELQYQHNSKGPLCYCSRVAPNSPTPACLSPWSLGSQGTASFRDDSISGSPCMNEDCDWYASNFKNYSEEEEEEEDEDWVSKVENLAAQVRKTNKMWKNRLGESECSECMVSRDTKK